MAHFKVNWSSLANHADGWENINKRLLSIGRNADEVARKIDTSQASLVQLRDRLMAFTETNVISVAAKANELSNAARTIAYLYRKAEAEIQNRANFEAAKWGGWTCILPDNKIPAVFILPHLPGIDIFAIWNILNGGSIGASFREDDSLWSGSVSGEYGTISAQMGASEVHGGISGQFFSFDEDGNRYFDPGLEAYLGASVCLLTATAVTQVGNDWLGAYGNASVDIGKLSADGKLSLGLLDKDGKFDPEAHLKLRAEAIAAQASASAGVTILGTDANISGNIGVGAGAHLDIGIHDGTLVLDAGAYVGIGGSIGIEISLPDYEKVASMVGEAASAIWTRIGFGT